MELEMFLSDGNLIVRLIKQDDQGGTIEAEASIPARDILVAAGAYK